MHRELINEYLRMRSQGRSADCELHNYEEIEILQDIHTVVKTWEHQGYAKGCMLIIAKELHERALDLEKGDPQEHGITDSDNVQVIINWATPPKTELEKFEAIKVGEVFYLVGVDGEKYAHIKNHNDAFTSLVTGEWINTEFFTGDVYPTDDSLKVESISTEYQAVIKAILNRL